MSEQTKSQAPAAIPAGENKLAQADEILIRFARKVADELEQRVSTGNDSVLKRQLRRLKHLDTLEAMSYFYRRVGRAAGLMSLPEYLRHERAWHCVHQIQLNIGRQIDAESRICQIDKEVSELIGI